MQDQQFSVRNPPSKSIYNFIDQNRSCPIKLKVEFEYGRLTFEWDCSSVKYAQGSYFRQIIVIDTECYDNIQSIFNIVKIFYKRLKLGDFMKILFTNQSNFNKSNIWIQKTSQKIKKQDILLQKNYYVFLSTTLETAIKIVNRFQQPAAISIFTKKSINKQDELYKKMLQINHEKSCCFFISLFQERNLQNIRHLSNFIDNFYQFIYKNQDQLEEKIKIFCNQQNKIRLVQAQIKLTCVNGDIYLRNSSSQSWILEKNTLNRKMYGLNNYTKYCCPLQINTFRMNKVGFQLEFLLTFIGGNKYKMKQIIYVSIQNSAKTIEEVKNIMAGKFRSNNYSLLPKQLRIQESQIENIMIKEKVSEEEYLSYQKYFFQ